MEKVLTVADAGALLNVLAECKALADACGAEHCAAKIEAAREMLRREAYKVLRAARARQLRERCEQ